MNALKGLFRKKSTFNISVYHGIEFSLDEIRSDFYQYSGGSVDLALDDESGIATICLNHPEKRNSITGKMMVDLEKAVHQLETWKIGKGLLLHGADHNFCSGGDLNFAQSIGTAEGGFKMAKFMQDVLSRLQNLPLITVAFIEGFALGGGAELAICCDFRLFSSNEAAMGFVHTKMGIIPAWGTMNVAVQTLGYRAALDLITTGRVVRGGEAQRVGLCDSVVGSLSEAKEWLTERTHSNAEVVRAAKSVISVCRHSNDLSEKLEFERRVFSPLWGGPAQKLAISKKIKHK